MTLREWLEQARADADRRGLPDLKPLLEALGEATVQLRAAPWLTEGRVIDQRSSALDSSTTEE